MPFVSLPYLLGYPLRPKFWALTCQVNHILSEISGGWIFFFQKSFSGSINLYWSLLPLNSLVEVRERLCVRTLWGLQDNPNKLGLYMGWVLSDILSSFHKNVIVSPFEVSYPLILHFSQSCFLLGWNLIPGPVEEVVPKFRRTLSLLPFLYTFLKDSLTSSRLVMYKQKPWAHPHSIIQYML